MGSRSGSGTICNALFLRLWKLRGCWLVVSCVAIGDCGAVRCVGSCVGVTTSALDGVVDVVACVVGCSLLSTAVAAVCWG